MPPTDKTPNAASANGSFELLYSVKAYDKIPVHEYKSTKTGLTVVIAEVDGPVVNGYFCLVTEAFDDDGLPHTLEHLVFLGSEEYPYKGVLDLLANRCLASGTNAWTDIDHTCYTLETAGSEGFLSLMPIYLDHILYPILSDEGYTTEVHHITGNGEDAGVVYCEIQGSENSAERRLHLMMARQIYPGKCGYSSETGGIMKNLRETCSNVKVRQYHKDFYRPENLKIIITGQVKHGDVFKALEKLENKIVFKGDRGPFTRPWQDPVPPIEESKHLVIKYPADEEKNGLFGAAWRGPSAVTDQYSLRAVTILMTYLTKYSVSPLQKECIEIPDPYASRVAYNLCENSESCLYFLFENVPKEKLPLVKEKLLEVLNKIVADNDIDMEQMKNIIIREKLENLSNVELNPHNVVTSMIIGHMLYGNTREDLAQRINPLLDLDKLLNEPKQYWIDLLRRFFLDGKLISIEAVPSVDEQRQMANDEKARIEKQIAELKEEGLKRKEEELQKAIEFNERQPPDSMLTCVPIPSSESINFHDIARFSSDSEDRSLVDLSDTPIYTYFDHVNSNFTYMFLLLDTTKLPIELRQYLPLLFETLLESPIERDGKLIPHEDVIIELNNDTISSHGSIGLSGRKAGNFKCGSYSHTACLVLQVESSKYAKGVSWLRELLYQTVFTAERIKIIANKMINYVSEAKRSGRNVIAYVMQGLTYTEESNQRQSGILKQHAFLTKLVEAIDAGNSAEVLAAMEKVRKIVSQPSCVSLYCAANLKQLKNAGKAINDVLPKILSESRCRNRLNDTQDHAYIKVDNEHPNCIVGMGCLESSYLYQCTPSINSYLDPDMPALLLYIQYLIQCEGLMWKQVRGKGLAYGYTIKLKANEGLLYLVFTKSTNIVGAYKEFHDIVEKQLRTKEWDTTSIESAKSSLIFEIVEEEKTIGSAISLSLHSYFQKIDYKDNRVLLGLIDKVTIDDLNRVGDKYIAPLLEPSKVRTAIVCEPSKAEDIRLGFEKMNHKLTVYPSLEESFLKSG